MIIQCKTAFGLACLALGAVLLAVGGAEIYRAMSTAAHGPTIFHLSIVALGLGAIGIGAECLGFDLLLAEDIERGEVAHSRWATEEDLIKHNIAEEI